MHRKDYTAIAKVLKDARATDIEVAWAMREHIATQLCLAFQEQHPQFRADLFMKACGIPQLHTLSRR
jgi:hypothetical protein